MEQQRPIAADQHDGEMTGSPRNVTSAERRSMRYRQGGFGRSSARLVLKSALTVLGSHQ